MRTLLVSILTLVVVASAETRIRITGSSSMSRQELMTTMGGRLEHIRKREATRPRAADAAFLVEQVFRKAGYNEVEVAWKILDPRTIQLRIDEGPRDLLGKVTIENIDDPELQTTLRKLFRLGPQKAAQGWDQLPLQQKAVEQGLQRIQKQMKSLGYYDAEVELLDRSRDPKTRRIDFRIRVKPGETLTLARPEIQGETAPNARQRIEPYVGRVASTENLSAIRSRMVEVYEQSGFVEAKVSMGVRRDGLLLTPLFRVERGKRFKLRKIEVTGLDKTRESRITKRLEGLKDGYFDLEESSKRIREMIATGAFSTIETEVRPVEGEVVDLNLKIEEAEARGLSGMLGFDSFEGLIIGGGYYDRNFRGGIRNLSLGFELSQRSVLGEVSLADPWLLGSDIAGKLRLFSVSRDQIGYIAWRSGLNASAIWQPDKHYSLELLLGWENVTTEAEGLPQATLGPPDYQNPLLRFTQMLDYRDNPIAPSKGWHLEMPFEIGAAVGGAGNAYLKTGFGGSYHHRISKRSQLSFGARCGVLIPTDDGLALPIDLRYFTGGARSVRSFQERRLGPTAITNNPIGGEGYWVANLEYIRQVAGPLKAVAFLDAGGLSRDWESVGLTEPEVALGLGIRLDLPIGPVRLEYGHNMTQDRLEPRGSWHFAIGTAF